MDFETTINHHNFILAEGAVIEILRRSEKTLLHPQLENALLIYDKAGRAALTEIYNNYTFIAQRAGCPMVIFTPTWRANPDRIAKANVKRNINADATVFLKNLRDSWTNRRHIFIGGLLGCKHDCYRPELGLTVPQAESFHRIQVYQLVNAGVDFLLSATMPAVPEACGMALAMANSDIPYIISFVINRQGNILDGISLEKAIEAIDAKCSRPPLGYMINCAYPSFLKAHRLPPQILSRLIGFQANASSLDQTELDGNNRLQADDIDDWGIKMLKLHRRYGLKILGGCCGTDPTYLNYLVREMGLRQSGRY
jgi:S-methylmethionine-dependent homocysteine/selenocysteine methylase